MLSISNCHFDPYRIQEVIRLQIVLFCVDIMFSIVHLFPLIFHRLFLEVWSNGRTACLIIDNIKHSLSTSKSSMIALFFPMKTL